MEPNNSDRLPWRLVLVLASAVAVTGTLAVGYYRVMHTDVRGGYAPVSLETLTEYPFDQASGTLADLPPAVRALQDRPVVLNGQMWAPDSDAPRLSQFQLIYSLKRNEHRPPQIQEFVFVTLSPGRKVPYHEGLVDVFGTFHIEARRDRGRVVELYHLRADRVTPVR